MLKKVRPSIWLPTIMVAWGIVMTLMGIVHNYVGLLTARIFLGVTEAGLFPGVAYYLTNWYRREEIQLRQAMFFSAASVAGAFSGLLAFAIGKMDGIGGLHGWQWIFILEGTLSYWVFCCWARMGADERAGITTVIVAAFAFIALFDFPGTASFLTEDERAFIVYRLKYQGQTQDRNGDHVAQADSFKWKYVKDAFLDWQIWVNIFVYWGVSALLPPFRPRAAALTSEPTGRLPPVRHLPLPSDHHPRARLQEQRGAADDRAHLHHGGHPRRRGRLLLG
jgi:MFS family permease